MFVTPTKMNVHEDGRCFMVKTWARQKTTETVVNRGWRSLGPVPKGAHQRCGGDQGGCPSPLGPGTGFGTSAAQRRMGWLAIPSLCEEALSRSHHHLVPRFLGTLRWWIIGYSAASTHSVERPHRLVPRVLYSHCFTRAGGLSIKIF